MHTASRVLAIFAVLSFALGQTSNLRLDKWRVIGPGGGGAQFIPTVSPHDPNQVLVACDMTGSYLTRDAGASWRMFNLRGRVHFFVFDPIDRNVFYAKATGLWRSSDGANTWQLIHPDPAAIQSIDMSNDHADERIVAKGDSAGTVTALAVDPADSDTLFAAVQQDRTVFSLQESRDRGRSWKTTAPLTGGRRIFVDPQSPKQNRTLYVAGPDGISVRENGQWSRNPAPAGAGNLVDISGGFPAEGGKLILYAIAPRALFISTDAGAQWTRSGVGPEGTRYQAVATSANFPNAAYVSYSRLKQGTDSFFGVARTTNFGRNWDIVWKESRTPATNIQDAWVTELFGPTWGENPLSLGVAPQDPELCYGTDYGRTLRTTDGGKTWKAVYSTRLPDGSTTSSGLDVTTCYGVHFDPFDQNRVFISYTDIGLFRSENGGRSWISSSTGVPKQWVNTTYWMVFDPQVRGRAWGVMSGIHDLPRPKMWRSISPASYNGGVCVSNDGGINWVRSTEGMPETAATHIILDPHSPSSARVLYVAAYGRGVFKSVDGGKSWVLKNAGIEGAEPFAWRLALDGKGALYLVVARRSDDGSIGSDKDGALYRSDDGAESWTRLKLPEGVNGPNGLAIDPADPARLYLAAWGRQAPVRQSGGGIFISTDRGATWRASLAADQHVYDVTIDPENAAVLYACGFESSAWRSADRGENWQRIKGYNFKWGHRVIPDPVNPQLIYITTFGGSVWHGPATGDPGAPEDIATPSLKPLPAKAGRFRCD
jgi:hypothetical protein